MTNLNGWQRLWVVLTVLWVMYFVIALFAFGLPAVYEPPRLTHWTVTCDLKGVVERLVSTNEAEAEIGRVIQAAESKDKVAVELWRPQGDLTEASAFICSEVALVYNPKTKEKQLSVFARPDLDVPFGSGYDLQSALGNETIQRIDLSKRQRRNSLWFGCGLGLGLPALLYGFGASVAWIRRGFKQDR